MKKKKNFAVKMRILPLYWKVVATVIGIVGGGSLASWLFTSASDFLMVLGLIIAVLLIWLLINMWLPEKSTDANQETKIDNEEAEADDSIVDLKK